MNKSVHIADKLEIKTVLLSVSMNGIINTLYVLLDNDCFIRV